MVLMEALPDLSTPYRATTQLVDIATLRHQYVTDFKSVVFDLINTHTNGLDGGKVKVTILNIGNTKIRQLDRFEARHIFTQRYT